MNRHKARTLVFILAALVALIALLLVGNQSLVSFWDDYINVYTEVDAWSDGSVFTTHRVRWGINRNQPHGMEFLTREDGKTLRKSTRWRMGDRCLVTYYDRNGQIKRQTRYEGGDWKGGKGSPPWWDPCE